MRAGQPPVVGRFIPAWAGNTVPPSRIPTTFSVHPRVGGEHSSANADSDQRLGSSPRGRGTRQVNTWLYVLRLVHPRVGGEHRLLHATILRRAGSSPRGRGTPAENEVSLLKRRFIPAWAGNTYGKSLTALRIPVHPRVGGEHGWQRVGGLDVRGSSPRGRGTPFRRS